MLSGRGLCDELITHPEESYRMWCVVVCDLETSRMGAPYIYDISRLRVKRHATSPSSETLNLTIPIFWDVTLFQKSHVDIHTAMAMPEMMDLWITYGDLGS